MLLIGKFLTTHGVDGGIKLVSYCENPEDIFNMQLFFDNRKQIKIVKKCNTSKFDTFVVYVNDIKILDEMEKFRNKNIYSNEDELKENKDSIYFNDLMDMKVISNGGNRIGAVVNIHSYGAGDSIEVKWNSGEVETIPLIEQYIKSIDKKNKVILIEEPTYI